MGRSLHTIYRLGVKELWSLWRDPMMLVLMVYTFSFAIYFAGTAMPETLHRAPIAILDEDHSALSQRIVTAFYPPHFMPPLLISAHEVDPGMDAGQFTFSLDIPPNFQRDVLAGRSPKIQLNIDATRMSQAFEGNGDIIQIVQGEVNEFLQNTRNEPPPPVDLVTRYRFNPSLTLSWFGSLMEMVNNITMLSIILTGAALIREREHGTVEHLLVMPVTPTEIMLAKIWSMALVVLIATGLCLTGVIGQWMRVPIQGSLTLFMVGTALHLFATTAMGIFLATVALSMPQFGLLLILTLMPLELLSGGMTPRESMPVFVRDLMLLSPTTHFTEMSQAILFRGAGLDVVWKNFLPMALMGAVLFYLSLIRFRKTIGRMA